MLGLAVLTGCNHPSAHSLPSQEQVPAAGVVSAPAVAPTSTAVPSPPPSAPGGPDLSGVTRDLSQLDRASAQVDGDLANASSAEQSGG